MNSTHRPFTRALFALLVTATLSSAAHATEEEGVVSSASVARLDGLMNLMPDLRGVSVAGWTPLFAPRSDEVVAWEAKLVAGRGVDHGSAILTTTGRVLRITVEGASVTERLARDAGEKPFRVVPFGSVYFVAEDERGERIASVGRFPGLRIDQATNLPVRGAGVSGGTYLGSSFDPIERDLVLVQWDTEAQAYEDYVVNYDAWFNVAPSSPPDAEEVAEMEALMDPWPEMPVGAGDTSDRNEGLFGDDAIEEGFEYRAMGHGFATRVAQLDTDDPLNTQPLYASGCGGQAFFNLFAWHDGNWTPSLLPGDLGSDTYVAMHLNNLREYLGTFWSFGQGATFPWHMSEGVDYARFVLNYYTDWVAADEEDWIRGEMPLTMIARYGKPVIVGYVGDVHYDVAWKALCEDDDCLYWVDFDGGTWVDEDEVYYSGAAFDFRPTSSSFGYNAGFEHGLKGWYTEPTTTDRVTGVIRDSNAAQGTAYAVLDNTGSGSSVRHLWRQVDASGIALGHTIKLWVSMVDKAHGSVRVRATGGQAPDELPNGTIITWAALPEGKLGWQRVTLQVPQSGRFTFEVVSWGDDGTEVRVDGIDMTSRFKEQPPPKEPCILGKPGLDQGCDFEP